MRFMHNKMNWDDLRYVLAVAKAGSVSGAARDLGVNHATVLRRVASFEDHHNTEVFEKTPRGYFVRPDRFRVIEAVKDVANAVLAVNQQITGAQVPLHGKVTVTSTDTFCSVVLPRFLPKLAAQTSGLQIELISTNAHLDLRRLRADITVRPAPVLPDDLTGQVVARLGMDVYGAPNSQATNWIALTGALERVIGADWTTRHLRDVSVVAASDSFLTLRELASQGIGHTILPCILADNDPRLVRYPNILPTTLVNIWVASHPEMATVPRVRAVSNLLARLLERHADELAGLPAG